MKFAAALLVAVALAAGSAEAACTFNGTEGINKDCGELEAPYCRRTSALSPGTTPTYDCVACLSDCDCNFNEYCSSEPGSIGTCTLFEQNGKPCHPYDNAGLLNAEIDAEYKCADLYEVDVATGPNGTVTALAINHEGFCRGGICQICTPSTGSCGYGTGFKRGRSCVTPGVWSDSYSTQWAQGNYQQNPKAVWWAIFFVFFLILGALQAGITIKTVM